MIPRILVPEGARLADGEIVSTRRRPSNLDERTLVPSTLPIVPIDGRTTIPSSLPLEAIAARTVVPRDINIEKVQEEEHSQLPAQPSELDERITIPQGAVLPEHFIELPPIDEELVQPDLLQTGEVAFLTNESRGKLTLIEKINAVVSISLHIAVVALIIFAPKIFAPHVRTNEEEDIARRQITVLLPPGALDSLKEAPAPRPAPHVNVDPRIIRKVAPTVPKPTPVPEPTPEPKKELPTAPTPQPNAAPPPPTPQPKTDQPKAPLKLENPDTPQPKPNALILPADRSPGDAIRDASRSTGRLNSPAPIGGGGQIPMGGSQGGGRGGGLLPGPQILSDTEGVDFDDYLRRVYVTVKRNWFSVMPPSVQLGDQGVVSLQFKIYRDGTVVESDPQVVYGSGKDPLDRAAVSSIRASNPFPTLPPQFKGPFIELRFTYYYNLRPPNQ